MSFQNLKNSIFCPVYLSIPFSRHFPFSKSGRTELFDHYLSKVKADSNEVNAASLAKKTVGFLGAQIANMVNQAAIKAARENACRCHGCEAIHWPAFKFVYATSIVKFSFSQH